MCSQENQDNNEQLHCTLIIEAVDEGIPKLSSRAFLDVTISSNIKSQKIIPSKSFDEVKNILDTNSQQILQLPQHKMIIK